MAGQTVHAAIDIGSNSVHLLVAVVAGHHLSPLADESVFLGLGQAADGGGFGALLRAELAVALLRYVAIAARLGAVSLTLVGTEPLRRSPDAAEAIADTERVLGRPLQVLTHEEEGILTLIGATGGRPVGSELVVVDIGGGSSEFVVVGPGRDPIAVGVQVGSARLTARHVRHDPPTAEEVALLRTATRELVATAPRASPHDLILVGGTAENLARLVRAATRDRALTGELFAHALTILAAEPSTVIAEHYAIKPARARVLPAGAVIVETILDHYGVDRASVSAAGIREGTILAVAAAGETWRRRLTELARGWVRSA